MKKIILISVFIVFLPGLIMAADKISVQQGLLVNKANFLIQHNKTNQAVAILEEFLKDHKEKNTYYIDFLLGKCLYDIEQMGRAAKAFARAYETSKEQNPDALYYTSTCYFLDKNYAKALGAFNQIIKSHPDKIKLEWKGMLVNILFAMERYKQALPWIEQLAENFTGKKKKKWQEVLLYQYISLKMEKKALGFANFLTKTDPTEPKWWKALTHIYLNKDNYEKGLESLMIYSFLKPLSQQETSLMADLYLSCNIPLKAAEFYQKWLNKEITNNFGKKDNSDRIYAKIKRISNAYVQGFQNDNAIKWINKGLKLKNDPILLKIKADIFYGQKQYKSALKVYKKLLKFKKYKGKALLMMGYCAWNENLIKNAISYFKGALKFANQRKSAQRALKHLKNMGGFI